MIFLFFGTSVALLEAELAPLKIICCCTFCNFLAQPRGLNTEMEKRADSADISVLFFSGCANVLAEYAQTM